MTLMPDLERDLVAAAARRSRRRGAPRRGRAVAAAMAVVLVSVGVAGAATGVLPVGSVIRGDGFHGERSKQTVRETVVAAGETRISGRWRMTTFTTGAGAVPCLKATLLDPPRAARTAARSTGYCGHLAPFDEFGHGTRAAAIRRGEVLLFGSAPTAATRVRLTAQDGRRIVVGTQPGPARDGGAAGLEGARGTAGRDDARRRFWLLAAPPGLRDARLQWVDRAGRARGRPLDVSHRFEGPAGRVQVASGRDPLTGPWQMIAYESRGSTFGGDRVEPEGLPGLQLRLPRPPMGLPVASGGSGLIRNAPGFSRGQHTLRDRRARAVGTVLYGRAPERADHVRIAAAGGVRLLVPTRKGPAGVPGRFWFTATERRLRNGHLRWVDTDTGAAGPAVAILPP